jgi:hypothetical protein
MPLGEHARMVVVLEPGAGRRAAARARCRCGARTSGSWAARRAFEAGGGRSRSPAAGADLSIVACFSMGGAARPRRPAGGGAAAAEPTRCWTALTLESFGLAGVASVLSASHLAWSLAELGELEAIPSPRRAAAGARRRHALSLAYRTWGSRHARPAGDSDDGRARGRPRILRRRAALFPPLTGDLAVVYALSGRIDRALELAGRAVERRAHGPARPASRDHHAPRRG